ncbi:LuxR C-terminal-related transcriptional regulator [Chitinophaga sp.]|uniref:LuxR C-terminal-related transcriptional regulator n=1 Tax=Chitinophaga sp. TaxID=1869181 RepID=UPI0031D1CC2F
MKKIGRVQRKNDLTFERHLQDLYFAADHVDEQDVKQLLSKFRESGSQLRQAGPLLYVVDYTSSRYLAMSDASRMITGYDPREFLEGGIPFLMDIYQPDDFRVYNHKVFPANMQFLQSLPQEEHSQFIFSYNFRVRHRNGHYVPVLQHGAYITSKLTGLPLYSLGIVTDISLVKKDRMIYHAIEKTEESGECIVKRAMQNNFFYPYEEDSLLSRHEKHILEMLAGGSSSKQIADKLKISENTVANHRKNMLRKTNTRNVAELIAFACSIQLI